MWQLGHISIPLLLPVLCFTRCSALAVLVEHLENQSKVDGLHSLPVPSLKVLHKLNLALLEPSFALVLWVFFEQKELFLFCCV